MHIHGPTVGSPSSSSSSFSSSSSSSSNSDLAGKLFLPQKGVHNLNLHVADRADSWPHVLHVDCGQQRRASELRSFLAPQKEEHMAPFSITRTQKPPNATAHSLDVI